MGGKYSSQGFFPQLFPVLCVVLIPSLRHVVMLLCSLVLRIMLRQWEETRAIASQLLESGDHMLLVDFDSHLDDITKDWTNQKLNTKIAELASPANGNL